jgi:ribosome-associated heat shock protein Hsp15
LSAAPTSGESHGPVRQRLDKWLWFARVVKTRSLATRLVADGHVRVNGQRVETPAKLIAPGDVLTIALERDVKTLRVAAAGERRGPYPEARLLYEDLSPPREPGASTAHADGASRPTKKERRDRDRLLDRD